MVVTRGDEVRADGPHRNGALRITIACTGVAAARFSLCLHVKSRHLGDAYRYPTERLVAHNQSNTRNATDDGKRIAAITLLAADIN
ncbi:hypothetical protein [Rubripirellula obstinata]|uniref:hypothetical protein n=1 Tax=Rubripirellula obstinata TaxID=406547 RepID=UPI001390689F|nr:hypothetical protein [Rubripirellula obstinata]